MSDYLYMTTKHEAVLRAHRLWGPRRWRAPGFARIAQELVVVGLLVDCPDGWDITEVGKLASVEGWGAVRVVNGVPEQERIPVAE